MANSHAQRVKNTRLLSAEDENLHGGRLLWMLADEELMMRPDKRRRQSRSEPMSVWAPWESSGETVDHLTPPSSRVADADFPSFPGWARSLEVCGSVEEAGLTNHGQWKEELRLKGEGPGTKEGGILWNSGKYQRETGACLYCFCPPSLSCCPTPIFAPSIRYHLQGQLMTTFGVLLPRQF